MYSGPGVSRLRDYLSELFNAITDEIAGQSGTEYDDDTEGYTNHMEIDDEDVDEEDDEGGEDDVPVNGTRSSASQERTPAALPYQLPEEPQTIIISREMQMSRERANPPIPRTVSNISNGQPLLVSNTAAGPSRRPRGFGHQPIVEASISPTPSDAASNRSGGTSHSTGTGFFRHYTEIAPSSRAGVITPDLVFAEIGHGRGTGASAISNTHHMPRLAADPVILVPASAQSSAYSSLQVDPAFVAPPSVRALHVEDTGERIDDFGAVLIDTSNSYHQHQHGNRSRDAPWRESASRSLSSSPTTRELQQSVQSVLGHRQLTDIRDADGRGRSVKRSLRSTITAAEQYASSFFFGRGNGANGGGSNGGLHDVGPSNGHRERDGH